MLNEEIFTLVKQYIACDRLPRLEGVGPISSVLLYATRGTGEAFANGRQFSAYPGLTPKQYSSGGKTVLIGISRYVANKGLRAVLIQGGAHLRASIQGPQDTQGALALGIGPGGRVWLCDSVSTNKWNIRMHLISMIKLFSWQEESICNCDFPASWHIADEIVSQAPQNINLIYVVSRISGIYFFST